MKQTLKFFGLLMFAAMLASCSSNECEPMDGPASHRNARYTMKLRLGGDYIEESDMPLTRMMDNVPGDTFIGVNVSRKEKGKANYTKYAYGVFTDPDAMNIDIHQGDSYEFEVTVLKNGTDKLQREGNNIGNPFLYGSSYSSAYGYSPENLNKFNLSGDYKLVSLNTGTALVLSNRDDSDRIAAADYLYPRVHRYYGTKTGYTYSSDSNGVIDINVTYECVGLKITSESLPEGSTLTWQQVTTNSKTEQYFRFSSDAKFEQNDAIEKNGAYAWEDIYSLNNFVVEDKSITLRFTLTRQDNTTSYIDKTVTLNRGYKKVLNVVISGGSTATGNKIVISGLDVGLEEDPTPVVVNL